MKCCFIDLQELLRLFGMPFISSPEEAEAQCVALQQCGLVDLVGSDDSDVWPFGTSKVCRYLFGGKDSSHKSKTVNRLTSLYSLVDVKEKLGKLD